MNRLIIDKSIPEFVEVAALSDTPYYDYEFNATDYACIDLEPEAICMLGFRFNIGLATHLDPLFLDRPTYVLHNKY